MNAVHKFVQVIYNTCRVSAPLHLYGVLAEARLCARNTSRPPGHTRVCMKFDTGKLNTNMSTFHNFGSNRPKTLKVNTYSPSEARISHKYSLDIQFLPQRGHCVSIMKTNLLMQVAWNNRSVL
jgi:hypothetical protein